MGSSLIDITSECVGRGHPDEGDVQSTQEIREEDTLGSTMARIKSMTSTPVMDFLFENAIKTNQQVVVKDHHGGADVVIIEDSVTHKG